MHYLDRMRSSSPLSAILWRSVIFRRPILICQLYVPRLDRGDISRHNRLSTILSFYVTIPRVIISRVWGFPIGGIPTGFISLPTVVAFRVIRHVVTTHCICGGNHDLDIVIAAGSLSGVGWPPVGQFDAAICRLPAVIGDSLMGVSPTGVSYLTKDVVYHVISHVLGSRSMDTSQYRRRCLDVVICRIINHLCTSQLNQSPGKGRAMWGLIILFSTPKCCPTGRGHQ